MPKLTLIAKPELLDLARATAIAANAATLVTTIEIDVEYGSWRRRETHVERWSARACSHEAVGSGILVCVDRVLDDHELGGEA